MKKQITFLAFICIISFSNLINAQNDSKYQKLDLPFITNTLTSEIKKIINETGIPSISYAIIKNDSILWSDAFGYTNVKKQVPATASTIYSTGSNFKFVTATAIMQLVDDGKLNIDKPINDYLGKDSIPDFSSKGTPVTLRHLLSHYSGLAGSFEIIPLWERSLPKSLEKIASEISSKAAPGINFEYCNHCYALAGLIIEKASGMGYEEYIVKEILEPLQIKSDGPISLTPSMVEELALPYNVQDNITTPIAQSRFSVYPAGDTYLTPTEMAQFYIAQLNGGSYKSKSILSEKSITEMQTPQFGDSYGLGIGIVDNDSIKLLRHSGGVPGFSTYFLAETHSKRGIYIAVNATGVQPILNELATLGLQLLNGDKNIEPLKSFKQEVFTEIEVPLKTLEKYVGNYQLTDDFSIAIFIKDGHLFSQPTGQNSFEIFPYEDDKFFLKVIYVQIEFTSKNNKITGLTLIQNGRTEGVKVK